MKKLIAAAAILAAFQVGASSWQRSSSYTNITFEFKQSVEIEFPTKEIDLPISRRGDMHSQTVSLDTKFEWTTLSNISIKATCHANDPEQCRNHGYVVIDDFNTKSPVIIYERGMTKPYLVQGIRTFKGMNRVYVGITAVDHFIKKYDHTKIYPFNYELTIEIAP